MKDDMMTFSVKSGIFFLKVHSIYSSIYSFLSILGAVVYNEAKKKQSYRHFLTVHTVLLKKQKHIYKNLQFTLGHMHQI